MTIGAYIKPGINLTINGGGTDRKISESVEWQRYSFDLGGTVSGIIEGGLTASFLPNVDAVKFDITGYASTKIYGGVNYRYVIGDIEPNQLYFACGTDPLIIGVNAKVALETILLDMELLDYKKEWQVLDRIQISSDPITF